MTTREYAQTIELLELHGIAHDVVGPEHGGAGVVGKARAMAGRLRALRAVREASRLRPRALARIARAPARRALARDPVVVRIRLRVRAGPARSRLPSGSPRRSSPTRSRRSDSTGSARASARCAAIRASRRSTTSRASSPTPSVLDELGLDRERVLVVVRTPPDVSLYHRHGNPLFADVLERLGRRREPFRPSSFRAPPSSATTSWRETSRRSSSPSTRSTRRASSRSPISSSRPAAR